MADRLFFSTDGIDWNDDESIDAFARKVWEQAAREFTKAEAGDDEAENNECQGERSG
jgi:hypothetical protein